VSHDALKSELNQIGFCWQEGKKKKPTNLLFGGMVSVCLTRPVGMSSSNKIVIVSHIDVAKHFQNLDRELQIWENRRNENGGFELVFGAEPSMLNTLYSSYGCYLPYFFSFIH
jgi:hypothetical protein